MKILEQFQDIQNKLYCFSELIPIKSFLIFGELSLIFILLFSLLFHEYLNNLVVWLVVIFLGFLIILSFLLLFSKHNFTLIAFLAGMFLIAGLSIISFFIELTLVNLHIHMLEILFIVNAIFIFFIGFKLLTYQKSKIEKKGFLLMSWIYSILFIAYIPVSEIDMSLKSVGYGLVTSLLFGGFLSAASSLLYLKNLKADEMRKEKILQKNRRRNSFLEDHTDDYEKINKLQRD